MSQPRLEQAIESAHAIPASAFYRALVATLVLATSAANATLLGNNAPLMVGFGAWLVFHQRPTRRFWIGLTLALAVASSAATLFIVCLVLRVQLTGYPLQSWLALAGLGLVTQVIGYLCVTYTLGRLRATATRVGRVAPCGTRAVHSDRRRTSDRRSCSAISPLPTPPCRAIHLDVSSSPPDPSSPR